MLLADGTIAVIRLLRPDDRDGLTALHAKASDRSVRMRFFSASRSAGPSYVEHLYAHPEQVAVALVATVRGEVVATATAERVSAEVAEVAFLVSDAALGRGLGTLLLEHLAAAGRDRGIETFTADVLVENTAMLRVFAQAGFVETRSTSYGVVSLEIATASSVQSLARADERESAAEARSLAPLLRPRTVAVLGVRRDGTGTGAAVLGAIRRGGYTGRVHVVHPSAEAVDGTSTHRSLVAVPEHVDLAVLAVPAAGVLEAMEDAAAAGVSAVVVLSSGFAELGADGARLQQRLHRLARDHDVRLVGPNCLGVISGDPDVRLNATFTHAAPLPGGLAIASQSGGVGIALLDLARRLGLGVALLRLPGQQGRRVGQRPARRLAARSRRHRGRAVPGVLRQRAQVRAARDPLRRAQAAARRRRWPLLAGPPGRRLAHRCRGEHRRRRGRAVHASPASSGAATPTTWSAPHGCSPSSRCPPGPASGSSATPAASASWPPTRPSGSAWRCPSFPGRCASGSPAASPARSGSSNPVDVGAGVSAEELADALVPLLGSDEVDAVLLLLVATVTTDLPALVATLARLRADVPATPVLLVTYGEECPVAAAHGLTPFDSATDALESLAHAAAYAAWLRVPHLEDAPVDRDRARAAARTARSLVGSTAADGSGWLAPAEVTDLLDPYGLAPLGSTADTVPGALAVADRVGYPVAVKVADPEVLHKSDRGLVRVDLRSPHEVTRALADFATVLGTDRAPSWSSRCATASRSPSAWSATPRSVRWSCWPPVASTSTCGTTGSSCSPRSRLATPPARCVRCGSDPCWRGSVGGRRATWPASSGAWSRWAASPSTSPRSPSSTSTRCWWVPRR